MISSLLKFLSTVLVIISPLAFISSIVLTILEATSVIGIGYLFCWLPAIIAVGGTIACEIIIFIIKRIFH